MWEYTDLVHRLEQRHVRVPPGTADNVWAPGAYDDGSLGAYVVSRASKLYDEADTDHGGSAYNR